MFKHLFIFAFVIYCLPLSLVLTLIGMMPNMRKDAFNILKANDTRVIAAIVFAQTLLYLSAYILTAL